MDVVVVSVLEIVLVVFVGRTFSSGTVTSGSMSISVKSIVFIGFTVVVIFE